MKHEIMEAWKPDEDIVLERLMETFGTKWSLIQRQLPHRTVSSIRNRYCRIRKGATAVQKNRCHRCGQFKRGHTCMVSRANVDSQIVTNVEFHPLKYDSDSSVTEGSVDQEHEPRTTILSRSAAWCGTRSYAAQDLGFDRLHHPPTRDREFFFTSVPDEQCTKYARAGRARIHALPCAVPRILLTCVMFRAIPGCDAVRASHLADEVLKRSDDPVQAARTFMWSYIVSRAREVNMDPYMDAFDSFAVVATALLVDVSSVLGIDFDPSSVLAVAA